MVRIEFPKVTLYDMSENCEVVIVVGLGLALFECSSTQRCRDRLLFLAQAHCQQYVACVRVPCGDACLLRAGAFVDWAAGLLRVTDVMCSAQWFECPLASPRLHCCLKSATTRMEPRKVLRD